MWHSDGESMVNKAAVVLLGGIVVVGVVAIGGVGALVLGVGGGDGAGTATPVDATPLPFTPTEAPTPTASATPTEDSSAATATTAAVQRTTILPRRFDERRVETLVGRYINDRREAQGLDPLALNGSTAGNVRVMARDHSVAMADAGRVTHVLDDNSSTDRYRQYDLYRTCQWKSGLKDSVVAADNNGLEGSNNSLEAVGRTVAGQPYGDSQFNDDEAAVARAIVEAWFADDTFEQRLTLPNAGSVGVGIEITQSGEVYATANLCS